MAEEWMASWKRSKLARKKNPRLAARAVLVKKKPQPAGQITIPVAQKRADNEKVAWKGGFTRFKNVPKDWDGDE